MKLSELIQQYKTESYKFYKHHDIDGNEIKDFFFFETHEDYFDKYLGFYKKLPDFTQVIVYATNGTFKVTKGGIEFFIRHNHQEVFRDLEGNIRGVSLKITKEVRNNLLKRINDLMAATTFDEIHQIVSECKVSGFGSLAIYDTSQRIASQMNIEPDKIYLMAGAKEGIETLEQKGYVMPKTSQKRFVKMEEMPNEFKALSPAEVHHFACAKKKELNYVEDRIHSIAQNDIKKLKCKDLIISGKIKECIQELKEIYNYGHHVSTHLVLIEQRWNSFTRDKINRVLSIDDLELKKNKILYDILEILEKY